jgi:hypothetical protein
MSTKLQRKNELFETVWREATLRGDLAARACKPVPMVVEQHASAFDDASPVTRTWVVEGGVCGFAWVTVRPASCSFAKWLKARGYAKKVLYTGMQVWVSQFGQSVTRKEAYADAMAAYLRSVGIRAYSGSRLD